MEVRRTAPVKLIVPDERHDDLHESARQFLHCANRAAEFCWDDHSYTNCVTANSTARDALYTDRGQSADGSQFTYRNDVSNHYFVSHDESIYLVQVVVDIGYLSLLGGLLIGVVGLLLVASGLWARRSSPSLDSNSRSEVE